MANTKTTTAAKKVKPVATEAKAVAETKTAATTTAVEATKKEAATKEATKEAPKKEAPKKEAATKKAATKKEAPAKKEAATKKTTTAKKTTTKKTEIKTNVLLQFAYKEVSFDDIVANVKEAWTSQFMGKLSDIKTLDIYVKPEEHKAYFVVNGDAENTRSINL